MSAVPPAVPEPTPPPPEPPTPSERRLLRQLAQGQTPAEAAESLYLTPAEAEAMLAELLDRHGLSEPRRLIARALIHRWI